MLVLNMDVFDDIIAGTTTTWYTPAEYDSILGDPDDLTIIALATDVSGTASLQVYADLSADDRSWFSGGGALITTGTLKEGTMAQGFTIGTFAFARLRITLTGTSPHCRLKLSATGRNLD